MNLKWSLTLLLLAGGLAVLPAETPKIPVDEAKVLQEARALDMERASQIEEYLKNTPDDPLQRSILASYYFASANKDPALRIRKIQNILWMIEHYPQLEIMLQPAFRINPILDGKDNYLKGADSWADQAKKNPSQAQIAANAASYFLNSDKEKAEYYFLKARELAPENSDYAWRLAELYFQPQDVLGGIEKDAAVKALKHFKDAYRLSDTTTQCRYLPEIVKAAWYAEDITELEKLAGDMKNILENNPLGYQGALIFWSNTAYGMLAVQRKDYKTAANYLLKSAETPGSSKLNSFGPNMLLAQAVLEHGDKESVLKFFSLCERFWKIGKKQMQRWIKDMNLGDKPNFGAHLYY